VAVAAQSEFGSRLGSLRSPEISNAELLIDSEKSEEGVEFITVFNTSGRPTAIYVVPLPLKVIFFL
jgi:hypothetical protein